MRIGIDIDNTLTNTTEYIENLREQRFPNLSKLEDLDSVQYEEFLRSVDDDIHKNVTLKDGAKDALDWMHAAGHEVYIITARGNYSKNALKDTEDYFHNYGLYYDKIIANVKDKGYSAKINGIDLFIDDLTSKCAELKRDGIDVINFASPSGQVTFKQLDNWPDIVGYLKIYRAPIKVGFALDDTIFDTKRAIAYLMKVYYPQKFDFSSYDREFQEQFLNKYMPVIEDLAKINNEALRTINYLYDKGFKIYIVTKRGNKYMEEVDKTRKLLEEAGLRYHHIIFNAHDKAFVCQKYGLKYLVDNTRTHKEEDIMQTLSIKVGVKNEKNVFADWQDLINYLEGVMEWNE